MSAAEKLKALENFGPPENYDDMRRLQRSFPRIVAVVEAAEGIIGTRESESLWGRDVLAALAALDEGLGDVT